MDWTDGPATWKQIRYLSHFGYKPDHALTKSEAIDLIRRFGGQPEHALTTVQTETPPRVQQVAAYDLRVTAQNSCRKSRSAHVSLCVITRIIPHTVETLEPCI